MLNQIKKLFKYANIMPEITDEQMNDMMDRTRRCIEIEESKRKQ